MTHEMTFEEFERALNEAYASLAAATKAHHEAVIEATTAAAALESQRLAALISGEITGRNADVREAAARAMLCDEYTRVEALNEWQRQARLRQDLAELGVKRLRAILRLYELEERVRPQPPRRADDDG